LQGVYTVRAGIVGISLLRRHLSSVRPQAVADSSQTNHAASLQNKSLVGDAKSRSSDSEARALDVKAAADIPNFAQAQASASDDEKAKASSESESKGSAHEEAMAAKSRSELEARIFEAKVRVAEALATEAAAKAREAEAKARMANKSEESEISASESRAKEGQSKSKRSQLRYIMLLGACLGGVAVLNLLLPSSVLAMFHSRSHFFVLLRRPIFELFSMSVRFALVLFLIFLS